MLAHRAGFSAARTMYNSPALDPQVAVDCLKSGCSVVIDSECILQVIDALLKSVKISDHAKILLRVNPSVSIQYKKTKAWTALTSHASHTSKFGIPSEDIVPLLMNKVSNIPRIDGLHVHVGTQMDHVEPFVTVSDHLYALAQEIRSQTVFTPRIIDLGGGLGIPFSSQDDFPTVAVLADALRPTMRPDYEYWFEPGHSLVGNAVGLLGSIERKKTVRGKTWAIANVGFDSVMKISFLGWRHPVLGPDNQLLSTTGSDAVGSPLCFAGDIVLPSTDVSGLNQGDPIFIQHTGAYCGSCMNTFNGRRSGGTVVLRGKDDGFITLLVTNPPASLEDEALAKLYAWGAMSSEPLPPRSTTTWLTNGKHSNEITLEMAAEEFDPLPLSSAVVKDHGETWDYLFARILITDRSFEFIVQVHNQVSFCTMSLLERIATDAIIVAIRKSCGQTSKDTSVSGTSSRMVRQDQVSSKRPVTVRVDLSSGGPVVGSSTDAERSCKFTFNNGAVVGSLEVVYKE
jgi:diaminopimelate decarboxylase